MLLDSLWHGGSLQYREYCKDNISAHAVRSTSTPHRMGSLQYRPYCRGHTSAHAVRSTLWLRQYGRYCRGRTSAHAVCSTLWLPAISLLLQGQHFCTSRSVYKLPPQDVLPAASPILPGPYFCPRRSLHNPPRRMCSLQYRPYCRGHTSGQALA